MANRLAYRNWAWESGVTITASSAATGYPASNLSSSAPWKIWRSSAATTDQSVVFDLGTARAMTACLLRNYVIHAGGSVRFQANATNVWTAPTVDTEFTIPSTNRTKVLAAFIASQTLRYVRIKFVNTATTAQAVELGVAFMTTYLEFDRDVVTGLKMSRVDRSMIVTGTGGHEQVDQRSQQYQLHVDPNVLEASDRDDLLAVFDTVGTFKPLFVVIDEDDPNLMVYGKFVGGLPITNIPNSYNLWASPYEFREEL